ncbi:MAG: ABC transporter permease subunit [Verrucomicrobiota bacterium]
MSRRNIALVYRKELRDLLRDRRTIISMIVVPVVVMPLLMTGLALAAVKLGGKMQKEIPKVMVLGGADSPATMAALRTNNAFSFVPPSPDFTNLISDKKINAAIGLPANFDAAVQAGEATAVTIYTYEGEFKSMIAWQSLEQFFRSRRDRIVGERLAEHQLPEKLLTPFEIRKTNVASPTKVSGNLIGMILPYLVIVMCMTGAIYPSIDLTAGEKERGTMETLLCSPVARTHLVLGKGLVVLTVSLATACLSLVSNGAALVLLKKVIGDAAKGNALPLTIDPSALLAVMVMMLPLAIFFSGAMLAIGLYSRSAKEANSYLQPLLIVTIIPAAVAALPGVELNYRLALVPVLNVSLAGREIMSGLFHWNFMAVVFLSMCLYAAVAVAVAVALFKREDVLFRT